jgi:hypothetical protein
MQKIYYIKLEDLPIIHEADANIITYTDNRKYAVLLDAPFTTLSQEDYCTSKDEAAIKAVLLIKNEIKNLTKQYKEKIGMLKTILCFGFNFSSKKMLQK